MASPVTQLNLALCARKMMQTKEKGEEQALTAQNQARLIKLKRQQAFSCRPNLEAGKHGEQVGAESHGPKLYRGSAVRLQDLPSANL